MERDVVVSGKKLDWDLMLILILYIHKTTDGNVLIAYMNYLQRS